jgi:hypothetical protein
MQWLATRTLTARRHRLVPRPRFPVSRRSLSPLRVPVAVVQNPGKASDPLRPVRLRLRAHPRPDPGWRDRHPAAPGTCPGLH